MYASFLFKDLVVGNQVVARVSTPGPSPSPQRLVTTTIATSVTQASPTLATKGMNKFRILDPPPSFCKFV